MASLLEPRAEVISAPLQIEYLRGRYWELVRDYAVRVRGHALKVPCGFMTDLSSIPWFARPWLHWAGAASAGAVHDYLFFTGAVRRSEADKIWRDILLLKGVGWLRAHVAWLGLSAVSWVAYHRHRRLREARAVELGLGSQDLDKDTEAFLRLKMDTAELDVVRERWGDALRLAHATRLQQLISPPANPATGR